MQYRDKFNHTYKLIDGVPYVWGVPLGWQRSARYSTLSELLSVGEAVEITDPKLKR